MVSLLNWHHLAAKAQALSRSAYEALRSPASRNKAMHDAQSIFDHLSGMGFRRSHRDHGERKGDGQA
jgi:hypothetical protein